jgi:hypothetical protein
MFAQSVRFLRIVLDFSGEKLADRFHQASSHSRQSVLVFLCTPYQEGRFQTIKTEPLKIKSGL